MLVLKQNKNTFVLKTIAKQSLRKPKRARVLSATKKSVVRNVRWDVLQCQVRSLFIG